MNSGIFNVLKCQIRDHVVFNPTYIILPYSGGLEKAFLYILVKFYIFTKKTYSHEVKVIKML